jgi:hypothetical protein
MRKYILLVLLSFIGYSLSAQITLEHSFYNSPKLEIYNFSSGQKFVKINTIPVGASIPFTIYNLDYSINKSILIDTASFCSSCGYGYNSGTQYGYPKFQVGVFYISDMLFDNDAGYEICLTMSNEDETNTYNAYIFNDDGSILFKSDTSTFNNADYDYSYNQKGFTSVYTTSEGSKMILYNASSSYVYALPGTITTATLSKKITDNYVYQVYPNPASAYTKIDFTLPTNEIGTINIYDEMGRMMKNYSVDNTFGSLLINNQDFKSGTYFYTITSPSLNQTKKVIIIN